MADKRGFFAGLVLLFWRGSWPRQFLQKGFGGCDLRPDVCHVTQVACHAEGVGQTAIHLVCLAEGHKRILLQSLLKQQMSHLAMDSHEQRVGTGVVGSHAEALERLRGVTLVCQRQRLLVVAFCLIGRTPAKQEKGQEEKKGPRPTPDRRPPPRPSL